MSVYNWQQQDWPNFSFSLETLEAGLLVFSEKTGRISGMYEGLSNKSQQGITVELMLTEALKTSAIEGEFPEREDLMSSIQKNLGLHEGSLQVKSKSAIGLANLMTDVRSSFMDLLNEEKLFAWHRMLFQHSKQVSAGQWRQQSETMRVISGPVGKETVHFIAPPSPRVPLEMMQFMAWFNDTAPGGSREIRHAPIRAAIAHLYFESIHPFEDGNGRIGRAIAEKALSQTIGRPVILSLSRAMEVGKKDYYGALKKAQRSNEITPWLGYFVNVVLQAQTDAEELITFTIKKAKFFDRFRNQLNQRQETVISRMLEEGPAGFEGGMSAKKYQTIAKTSKATATRDMQQLIAMGAFVHYGSSGGRSTSYEVNLSLSG